MKEATCPCGWRVRGTDEEVIEQVIAHGRDAHGVETTRAEVLAIAKDVPGSDDRRREPA